MTAAEQGLRAIWLAWLVLWVALAWHNKRDARRESWLSRAAHGVPVGIGAVLLFTRTGWRPLDFALLPRTIFNDAAAMLLTLAGLGFAIWARRTIGRNWSGTVTLKQGHELMRTGPYRLVRHPIYSGLLLALAGTVLAVDAPRAILGFALITLAFLRKIPIEERFMRDAFGAAYDEYARTTPALIPGRS